MLCNRCGAPLGDEAGLCESCEADVAEGVEEEPIVIEAEVRRAEREARKRAEFEEDTTHETVSPGLILGVTIIVAALAVFIIDLFVGGAKLGGFAFAGQNGAPCQDKEVCLYVYLTPWSSESSRAIQQISSVMPLLREHSSSTFGIAAVVGGLPKEQLESYARNLPIPAFYDSGRSFHRAASVRYLPYWVAATTDGNRILGSIDGPITDKRGQALLDFLKDEVL